MKDKTHTDSSQPRSVYERMIGVFFDFYPVEDLTEIIHDTFLGYGTAAHEFFRNREEVAGMARIQAEQLREQTFDLSRKPITEKLLANGSVCLIVEEMDLFMHAMEHRLALRLSTLLEFKDGKWRVSHFHGSTPDSDIAEEEAFPMEGLRRKNEELEAKIRERTRELEIEASLDRVRAQSMLMQHSGELNAVSQVFHEQLTLLGIDSAFSFVWLPDERENTHMFWTTWSDGTSDQPTFHSRAVVYPMDKAEPYTAACFADWESGIAVHEHHVPAREIESFLASWSSLLEGAGHLKPENFPDGIWYTEAFIKYGCFGVDIHRPLSKEEKNILHRFAIEFERTYTRFLDLQKAEAQAREAEIELALERVRAQTMAMRHSDDLVQSTAIIFEELEKLNLSIERSGIGIFNAETRDCELWTTVVGKDGEKELATGVTSLTVHPMLALTFEAWEAQQPLSYVLEGKELADYYKRVAKSDFVLSEEVIGKSASLEREFYHYTPFGAGGLYFFAESEPSAEDKKIIRRFAEVFDLTYTRFLDLQKAEEQAREARIEAALERVRARTMAMQHADELSEASYLLDQQVRSLGIATRGCAFHIYRENDSLEWFGDNFNAMEPYPVPRVGIFKKYYEAGKRGDALYCDSFEGEACRQLYEFLCSLPVIGEGLRKAQEAGLVFPEKQYDHVAYFKYGYLLFITLEPVAAEEKNIFIRFAAVFEQTYTRFLDLKKAETQAREAQIETALERVRSRSMAMQTSEELQEVIRVIFGQMTLLNINAEHAGIVVDYSPGQDWNFWVADKQDIPSRITVPYLDLPWDRQFAEAREKGIDFFATHLNFEEKNSFYQKLLQHIPGVTQEARDFYFSCPGLAASTVLQEDVALYIENFSGTPYSDEENKILRRFGKVFQQTYTRFLDLQKAEAQAREARIEAALEKVRSRTMAMQHSDELPEAANVLFLEIQALGIPAWSCGYNVLAADKKTAQCWMSSEGTIQKPFTLRLQGEASFDEWEDFIQGDLPFLVQELGGQALESHYTFMKSFPDLEPIFADIEAAGLSLPTYQINHLCKFTHGFLLFITYEAVADSHDIFKRFSAVFEQTYTRFLDLKKVEAQAREARIETALERVRARALAMQQPEELKDVAQVLRREMGLLGVEELETSSIYINDLEADKAECWYAIKDLREAEKVMVADHFALDLHDTWVGREMLKFFASDANQVSIVMKGKQRREWIDYCEALSEPLRGYYGKEVPDRTYHLYKFSHGAIGVATAGELSGESWGLLRRAASVFSLAYSRFRDLTQARLDLQKLKEEKKRAEDALAELQLTQKQLVHAEKMASLGELTAGIAHEIQNPLNFVNNFSEVSRELLEEMIEELKKGDAEEADAIARDVIQNLEKIVHHGKRADGIVKGMLQHSRSGDGQKQPTDLNKLADEYLRLAYHGLRAKDKSFNASMETEFDPKLPQVSVVPQDIGRVLLNLVTNAFHAVSERKASAPEGFEPTVWVTTRKTAEGVEISVRDNGGGIPENIRDKIFQPFFTTKPTGQGTGLGLSMSYDIVTKGHSGQLKVASKVQEGTEFIVILPI